MKKAVLIIFVLLVSQLVLGEPIVLEQATIVNKPDEVELGFDVHYAYDKWTYEGETGKEYTRTELSIPLLLLYAYEDTYDARLVMPYKILRGTTTGLDEDSVKGLSPINLNVKGILSDEKKKEILSSGLMIDIDIPTGGSTKVLREGGSLSEGFNLGGILAIDKSFSENFIIRTNLGAKYKGSYTNINDAKVSPSPVYSGGIGIELILTKTKKKNNSSYFSLLCELKGISYGNYKLGDNVQTGTGGSNWDLVPGLRLQIDNIKAKLGVDLSIGEPSTRYYNYKLIAGISYLFK